MSQDAAFVPLPKQPWRCWRKRKERQKDVTKNQPNKQQWGKLSACNLSVAQEYQSNSKLISKTREEPGKGQYFSVWAILSSALPVLLHIRICYDLHWGVLVYYPKKCVGQLHHTDKRSISLMPTFCEASFKRSLLLPVLLMKIHLGGFLLTWVLFDRFFVLIVVFNCP